MPRAPRSNPAQRLHAILRKHAEVRSTPGQQGYDWIWAETMGVARSDVISAVAGVFRLIQDIDSALELADDDHMLRVANRYRDDWASAMIPQTVGRGASIIPDGPSEAGLDALGSVASFLDHSNPDGTIPDAQGAGDLHTQVQQLIGDIRSDESIPNEVRVIMIARLYDLAWALTHVATGGAADIRAAIERLVLAYMVHSAKATEPEKNMWARVWEKCQEANALISAPGAWWATTDLVLTAAPHVETAIRAITGG